MGYKLANRMLDLIFESVNPFAAAARLSITVALLQATFRVGSVAAPSIVLAVVLGPKVRLLRFAIHNALLFILELLHGFLVAAGA